MPLASGYCHADVEPVVAFQYAPAPDTKLEPLKCVLAVVSTIDTPLPALSVPPAAADTGTVNVPFAAAFPANVPVQFVPYVWPDTG